MNVLVVGASGATGRLAVEQLLENGHAVRIVVRSIASLPPHWKNHDRIEKVEAPILDLPSVQVQHLLQGCHGVVSCLGHNPTLKGIFGHPKRLVTDAVKKLTSAIESQTPSSPLQFILMNTVGNANKDLNETASLPHRILLSLIRNLVPPHADNEQAAEHLRTQIGQNHPLVEWVVVRPDSLLKDESVTDYTVHPSPTRDALFNPGKTSRINVAHFMAQLLTDPVLWADWKGQMPVIYNDAPH